MRACHRAWRPTHPGDPTPGLSKAGRLVIVIAVAVGVAVALMVIAVRPAGASDALDSPTMSQEPSPELPPWFVGRVAMPEYGFALTVPDGWVAFDVMGDVDEQARKAAAVLDVDFAGAIAQDLREMQQAGVPAAVIEASTWSGCSVLVMPDSPGSPFDLDMTVGQVQEALRRDETVTHLEQPVVVELPAGPALFIAVDYVDGTESAVYVGRHAGMFIVGCDGWERPDDDWLAIAETIEFLPVEE